MPILNLLHAIRTLTFLRARVAKEANPLMGLTYRESQLRFLSVKLGLGRNHLAFLARLILSGCEKRSQPLVF